MTLERLLDRSSEKGGGLLVTAKQAPDVGQPNPCLREVRSELEGLLEAALCLLLLFLGIPDAQSALGSRNLRLEQVLHTGLGVGCAERAFVEQQETVAWKAIPRPSQMGLELRELVPALEEGGRRHIPEPNVIVRRHEIEDTAADAPVEGPVPLAHEAAVLDEIGGPTVRRQRVALLVAMKNGNICMQDSRPLQQSAIDEG